MSKQLILSKEYQVLLRLLRLAIGTEPRRYFGEPVEPFPDDINWKEVIRLSYEQKVSALAVDGLRAIKYTVPDQQTQKLFDNWFKDVENIEKEYIYYQQVIQTLCQLFAAQDLKTIILKGIGLSENYPIPSHRGAGDIDLFILDDNNYPAAEKAVEIVERQLNIKTTKFPHDYEFKFKGIEVELHYDTTNAFFNTSQERYVVNMLSELLMQDLIPCQDIENAYLPSATFNALYLIRHTFGHFYTVSCNLRQYTDWVTFLYRHHKDIDWNRLKTELEKSNMKPYFDGLNTMLSRWFGLDLTLCPITQPNNLAEQITLKEMRHSIPNGRHLNQRIRYYYYNRDKLQFISGRHWVKLLNDSIITSLKHLLNPSKPLY